MVTTFINNGGRLDDILDYFGSKEGLKALAVKLATSAATAGALDSAGLDSLTSEISSPFLKAFAETSLNSLVTTPINAPISAAINAAASGRSLDDFDNNFEDYFKEGIESLPIDALAAGIAAEIGEASKEQEVKNKDGTTTTKRQISESAQLASHFATGCLIGELRAKGGCGSGAFGALIGEAVALSYKGKVDSIETAITDEYDSAIKENRPVNSELINQHTEALDSIKASQIINIAKLASAIAVGAAGGDVDIAADAGGNAAEHNGLGDIFEKIAKAKKKIIRKVLKSIVLTSAGYYVLNKTSKSIAYTAGSTSASFISDTNDDLSTYIVAAKAIQATLKRAGKTNDVLTDPKGTLVNELKVNIINSMPEGFVKDTIIDLADNIHKPDVAALIDSYYEGYIEGLEEKQKRQSSRDTQVSNTVDNAVGVSPQSTNKE